MHPALRRMRSTSARWALQVLVSSTSPPQPATAHSTVAAVMRSGQTACCVPISSSRPRMCSTRVPTPVISAPAPCKKARQIRHLRLHGRAAQHRLSSGCGRRHEKRLGGAHTGEAQADIRARKAVRRSDLQRAAVLLRDMRPHLLKAGKMHINGPRAQAAAAGRIDVRAARAGQQRRQIEQRGAHRAHQRLRHCAARKFRRRNDGAPILQQDLAAHALQDARRSLHVGQMRHVRERHRAAAQHRRRHDGQHTVLCAGYPHLSKKAAASADRQNFHIPHPVS